MKKLLLLAIVFLFGCGSLQQECSQQAAGAVEVSYLGFTRMCMLKQQNGQCLYFLRGMADMQPFVADCIKPENQGN